MPFHTLSVAVRLTLCERVFLWRKVLEQQACNLEWYNSLSFRGSERKENQIIEGNTAKIDRRNFLDEYCRHFKTVCGIFSQCKSPRAYETTVFLLLSLLFCLLWANVHFWKKKYSYVTLIISIDVHAQLVTHLVNAHLFCIYMYTRTVNASLWLHFFYNAMNWQSVIQLFAQQVVVYTHINHHALLFVGQSV